MTAAAGDLLVFVIGAMSDIGLALAHEYGAAGASLVLGARDKERLAADAQDLRLRYRVDVTLTECDILETGRHAAMLDELPRLPDVAICVAGLLGEQQLSARSTEAARLVMETNYVAPALLLGEIANRFEARGSGTIIGISSVAGDRGRASNYLYGSAKAGFTAFLSGLRARLSRTAIRVITVKPGFVATKMTAGMNLPPVLTAQPGEVARAVRRADVKGRSVIYVRPVWRPIMLIVTHLPEFLFKKMKS